jgi:hypothetical protein
MHSWKLLLFLYPMFVLDIPKHIFGVQTEADKQMRLASQTVLDTGR